MNPAEERLARWLEDELTGRELEEMDREMASQPEQLAAREELRRWKEFMRRQLPAEVEPPHAELFDARIARMIRETPQDLPEQPLATRIVAGPPRWFAPRRWLMPLASCAGMVLAFWLGTRQVPDPTLSGHQMQVLAPGADAANVAAVDVSDAPRALPVDAAIYAPDNEVSVEWIAGKGASVIVLDGMRPIPDETDFSSTASVAPSREIEQTAGMEP